eukprot:GHRR01018282.1.p1 GENE.GHRR01018282.1~~GHRR01018282.1.p1  ORF type:complete len:957 (+),score=419.42 GHRR01018282.1:262-3132(+)
MDKAKAAALLTAVEALLADSEFILVAAFQADELPQNGTRLLRAFSAKAADGLGNNTIMALTVRRSVANRGFLASIHFVSPAEPDTPVQADSTLQLQNIYPLTALHDLRVSSLARSRSGRALQDQQSSWTDDAATGELHAVELRCASHHNVPEHRAQYLLPDSNAAMLLASLIVQLLRHQDAVLPSMSGVTLERLDSWWCEHKQVVTEALSSFALQVVTPGSITVGRGGDSTGSVLVSAKEAAELEELLLFFELGLGESEQFAAALQEEASALEAANVYAILASGPLVEGVLGQLRHTQAILEDLDESLKVFDFKLRHMRDDIAAIEASNNSLERQARHNTALLSLLEGLLGGLQLDAGIIAQLEQPAFDPYKLKATVSAAWKLHAKRLWLSSESVDGLSPMMTKMKVVQEAQQQLTDLAGRFVARAVNYVVGLVNQLVTEATTDLGRSTNRRHKVSPPSHRRLHDALRRCQPLLQVVAVLDQQALQHLQQQVSSQVNGLLKRELHIAAAELKRGAAADITAASQAAEGDYTLTKERHAGGRGSKRLARVSHGSGSGGGSDSISDFTVDPAEFAGVAAVAGVSAAKRAWYLDGSATGLPLHEAWCQLLDGFMPFLADEAAFHADLLLMYRGDEQRLQNSRINDAASLPGDATSLPSSPSSSSLRACYQQQQHQQQTTSSGQFLARPPSCPLTHSGGRALEAMMAGLAQEIGALVDLASRSHQVLLLPALAITRAWQRRLQDHPASASLVAVLAGLCDKLQQQWASFAASQVTAIEHYDGRSKMSLQQGIKYLHVLPFISQFCLMAHDMEVALAEGLAAAAAAGQADSGSTEQPQEPGTEAAAIAAAQTVRTDADALYDELCPRLLSRLERLATTDPKYADRCRLENYSYVGEALRGLAAATPVLQQHWQVAESRREATLSSYVRGQLEYSKLWRLLDLGDKLDKLLQVIAGTFYCAM